MNTYSENVTYQYLHTMKTYLPMLLLVGCITFAQAKKQYRKPKNLYEQLCEVNPNWQQNQAVAKKLGFLQAPIISNEQNLLVFHVQILEKIFLARSTNHLNKAQKLNRKKHLKVLSEYWKRRDCPRNYYLPYRNPVFIDHEGRYCAVGYLMLKSGKQEFCEAVQKNSNFIKIREIKSKEFEQWQSESGLSLDELAWIQPYYDPEMRLEEITVLGKPRTPRFADSSQVSSLMNRYPKYHFYEHVFGPIFMGGSLDYPKAIKKYKYKGTPNWKALNLKTANIKALRVYRGILYVVRQTFDKQYKIEKVEILKWDTSGKWESVHETKANIYKFFVYGNQLYAAGGWTTNRYSEKKGYTHSYLARFDGKTWKKIDQEYGGIIFGLYHFNGKTYLATVINLSDRTSFAPIPPLNRTNK